MITKFWHWLFGGCQHKWIVIKENKLTESKYYVGYSYVLQCEKCGEIKHRQFME